MTQIIAWGQYSFRSKFFQPPGNSLRHIDVAYGFGYDGVELDLQLSRDNVLVLMHDNVLDRTTLATGPVNQYTARELSTVRLKDPWRGPPCYVETFESALVRNGGRGPVMVDMHHAVPQTVSAVARSVDAAGFDEERLILLTYTREGGLLYKDTFPKATVLLKARHDMTPPALSTSFLGGASGLDGCLVPIAGDRECRKAFVDAAKAAGLKLAVFMHDGEASVLKEIFDEQVDYVTSTRPDTFGAVKGGDY
ncbi:MAG: hypothetical protein NVV67_03050 [Pseudoxanthomonas sp.]|nr:hypothetical protein [Pseudoxanthomonas sp.]